MIVIFHRNECSFPEISISDFFKKSSKTRTPLSLRMGGGILLSKIDGTPVY